MDPLTLIIVLYLFKSLHQYHISKLSSTPFLLLSISLFIVYTVNLPVVQPWSYRVIYYFDTPTLGRRHQLFDRDIVQCVFLGYGSHTKRYQCYDPFSRKLYVTMDVTFLETEYFFNEPSPSVLQGENATEQQILDWFHMDHTKRHTQTELVIIE